LCLKAGASVAKKGQASGWKVRYARWQVPAEVLAAAAHSRVAHHLRSVVEPVLHPGRGPAAVAGRSPLDGLSSLKRRGGWLFRPTADYNNHVAAHQQESGCC
jgi:hypothetical protein